MNIISRWLYLVAALVFALVIVGGVTRLTGSGLSITEWRPVTGILPPLSQEQWLLEFKKYQTISQYELLNKGMALADFKVIFFWEWGHRLLARLVGFTLLLPLIYFAITKKLSTRKALHIFGIGLLVLSQAFVGWVMVASGLEKGMVAVAPLKLMLHLTLAAIIFSLLLILAREKAITGFQKLVYALLLFQLALGALVAGNHAGLSYNTFPLMDGGFSPSLESLFARPIWVENFFDNGALVQFNHRLMAYILLILTIYGAVKGYISKRLLLLIVTQATIGIATLVLVVPFSLAIIHQAFAFVLILAVLHEKDKNELSSL